MQRFYTQAKIVLPSILPFVYVAVGLCCLLFGIYVQYNNTFIIDEIFDGTGLRELTIEDKLTIR
jgi:hypothetical protein